MSAENKEKISQHLKALQQKLSQKSRNRHEFIGDDFKTFKVKARHLHDKNRNLIGTIIFVKLNEEVSAVGFSAFNKRDIERYRKNAEAIKLFGGRFPHPTREDGLRAATKNIFASPLIVNTSVLAIPTKEDEQTLFDLLLCTRKKSRDSKHLTLKDFVEGLIISSDA